MVHYHIKNSVIPICCGAIGDFLALKLVYGIGLILPIPAGVCKYLILGLSVSEGYQGLH